MKGINPFTPMIKREELVGRKQETALFESLLSAAKEGHPLGMLLAGTKGMGKTVLLEKFQSLAERSGVAAVRINAQKSDTRETIMKKIRAGIEGETENKSAVILIDNGERLRKEVREEVVAEYMRSDQKIPCMLVLASNEVVIDVPPLKKVILSPLTERDMEKLIDDALKPHTIKMGEECLRTIIDDSQGNPLILLTICWTLYDKIKENEKIISRGHYSAYLPAIMNNLAREFFDEFYEETAPAERIVLHALAKINKEMRVSEIAAHLGKPLNSVTALVLRLTKQGSITKVARGTYRIFNRLYGKYVGMK